MKVKCTRLLDAKGREVSSSPWLSIGNVYNVLSMHMTSDGGRSYEIVIHCSEDEWPVIGNFPMENLEVVNAQVPSNWHIWIGDDGTVELAPLEWQDTTFRNDFFDREPRAFEKFRKMLEKTFMEH